MESESRGDVNMGTMASLEEIEKLISEHPLVRSCIAVGEDRHYYGVMVAPDKANLVKKLQEENPQSQHNLDTYQGMNHIEIRGYYCDLLETVNRRLGGKRIERFALLDWEADKSREAVCADHKIVIDTFYQDYIPGIG
jgi:long-subunit acyl-CoA synthetase (AMP-forming)